MVTQDIFKEFYKIITLNMWNLYNYTYCLDLIFKFGLNILFKKRIIVKHNLFISLNLIINYILNTKILLPRLLFLNRWR